MIDISSGTQIATPNQEHESQQRSSTLQETLSDTPIPPTNERYTFLHLIAKGGMGAVFRATDHVLSRDVAIKVLLDARPTSETSRRFLNEACVTAQLQHPSIPPVYDIGRIETSFATDDDPTEDATMRILRSATPSTTPARPFLAMKLIQGRTLAALLAEQGHGGAKWLSVFESICQAVGYAHESGFIHRDLKPLNVMVGAFGEVQVMDWGLAKRLKPKASSTTLATPEPQPKTDDVPSLAQIVAKNTAASMLLQAASHTADSLPHASTELTMAGAVMGTPSYMAPEQARGEIDELDARADVFALGAILCELLTGQTPLTGQSTQIVEDCAQGRLAAAHERLEHCHEDPALIAIARQCLAFNPAERPANARIVAEHVAKFRKDSEARVRQLERQQTETTIRTAEEAKRNRLWVRSAIITVTVMGLGALLAVYQAVRATHAEQQTALQLVFTQAAESKARSEEHKAKTAHERTEQQLQFIKQSNEMLFGIFQDLNIREVRNNQQTIEAALAQRLIEAVTKLNPETIHDPKMLIQLREQLGASIMNLGYVKEAHAIIAATRPMCLAEHGPDHLVTLTNLATLAESYELLGEFQKSFELHKAAYEGKLAKLGPRHPSTLISQNAMGQMLSHLGRNAEASQAFEECYRTRIEVLGANHKDTLITMNNVASMLEVSNQLPRKVAMLEEVVARMKLVFGPDHHDTLVVQGNLAGALFRVGRIAEGVALSESTANQMKAKYGPDHLHSLLFANNLANQYSSLQRSAEAKAIYEEIIPLASRKLGADHTHVLFSTLNLSRIHIQEQQYQKAAALLERILEPLRTRLGPFHQHTLNAFDSLTTVYLALHDGPRLSALVQRQVELARKLTPYNEAFLAATLATCCTNLLIAKEYTAAEPLLRECLALRLKHQPDVWSTFNTMSMLGEVLMCTDRLAEAETSLRDGFEGIMQRLSSVPAIAAKRPYEAGARLVRFYQMTKRSQDAASVAARMPKEMAPKPRGIP